MQFDLALALGASRAAGTQPERMLPLLPLLPATIPEVRGGETPFEEQLAEHRRQRRDEQNELVANDAVPRPAQQAADAERALAPGSRSLRHEQLQEAARTQIDEHRLAEQSAAKQSVTQATRVESESSPAAARVASNLTPASGGDVASSATLPPTPPAERGGGGAVLPASSANSSNNPPLPAPSPVVLARPVVQTIDAAEVRAFGPTRAAGGTTPSATAPAPAGETPTAVQPATEPAPAGGNLGTARGTTTSHTSAPKAAAAGAPVEDGDFDANLARIMRSVHTRIGREHSTATLRLDPPELGMLRMRMDLQQSQLTLQVETQTEQARRLLTEHLDELRRGLEAAGIQLERVEVRVSAPASPDPGTTGLAQQQAGGQHGAPAHTDQGPAGGGGSTGTDALPAQPSEPLRDLNPELAAESRVNILA